MSAYLMRSDWTDDVEAFFDARRKNLDIQVSTEEENGL